MGRLIHTIVSMQYDLFMHALDKEYKLQEFNNNCPPAIKSKIEELRRTLATLQDTWSIMAGRNLMADVVRQLASFEPLLKGDCLAACIGLKVVIGKKMEGHSPSKARYHSVLCLGVKIKSTWGSYVGEPDDRADMEEKADLMIDAIKGAYNMVLPAHQKDGTMLKIFMAPEFFFRGANGAYDFDVVNGTNGDKSLVDLLRAEIDGPLYKDWLFVLGTVLVASKVMNTACSMPGCNAGIDLIVDQGTKKTKGVCKASKLHVVVETSMGAGVENVALIVKEGFVHSVAKELISTEDFNKAPGQKYVVGLRGENLKVNFNPDPKKPTPLLDERMGGNIFNFDGVTFGCEVCLDHIASSKSNTAGRLDHAGNIQIQLIPSGGMQVKKFRTVENGVIFNVDGATPHVEAIGLSTERDKNGAQEVKAFVSDGVQDTETAAKTWESMRKHLEAKAKVTHHVGSNSSSGLVLQYGPFEIPAV